MPFPEDEGEDQERAPSPAADSPCARAAAVLEENSFVEMELTCQGLRAHAGIRGLPGTARPRPLRNISIPTRDRAGVPTEPHTLSLRPRLHPEALRTHTHRGPAHGVHGSPWEQRDARQQVGISALGPSRRGEHLPLKREEREAVLSQRRAPPLLTAEK